MSCTEIFGIDKNGDLSEIDETGNAFRGAMAIWTIMEERYLPSLEKPYWMTEEREYYSRLSSFGDDNMMQEIWDIPKSDKVSRIDKIVMCTTFDYCIVKRENFDELLEAFDSFEGNTSLKEQAEIIREILDDENIVGVAWNQTSVNDMWHGSYDDDDEYIPFNINTCSEEIDNVFEKEQLKLV